MRPSGSRRQPSLATPNWMARRTFAFRVVAIYAGLGAAWILLSDLLVDLVAPSPAALTALQTYKGIVFILVSSLGLYLALRQVGRAADVERLRSVADADLQRAAAELSLQALGGLTMAELGQLAANRVQRALSVDLVRILDATGNGDNLRHRVIVGVRGTGSLPGEVPAGIESLAGYTLMAKSPVTTADHSLERRYTTPDYLLANGVVSSLSVPIMSKAQLGVLAVHQRTLRHFRPEEADFLQTIANLLAQAADRRQALEQVEQQAMMLSAVGQAVMATDLEGNITYWNRAAEAMYGWRADEVLGRPITQVTPAVGQRGSAEAMMERLLAGEAWSGEFQVQRKDGSLFPALVSDTPVFDAQGQLSAVIGISADLSALRQAEAELRRSEELHRVVLSNIGDAVFLTDDVGRLNYVGDNVHVIFGYSLTEAEALRSIDNLLGSDLFDPARLHEEGELINLEVTARDRTGDEHHLLVNVKEVDIIGSERLYTCRDVTERVRAERRRQRTAARLQNLRQIEARILAEASVEDTAAAALEGLIQLVPAVNASIVLVGDRPSSGRVVAVAGQNDPLGGVGAEIDLTEIGVTSKDQMRQPAMLQINDLATVTDPPPIGRRLAIRGIRSMLMVRLLVDDEPLGTMLLARSTPSTFDEEEAGAVQEVADSLALALRNAQLLERANRRFRELEALQRVSLRVTSHLDLGDALDEIATAALDTLSASDVHIFLLEGDQLKFGVARWGPTGTGRSHYEPRQGGISYRVAESGQRLVFPQTRGHPLFQADFPDWDGAIAGMPLRIGDQILGVMNVAFEEPHEFTEAELFMLSLLADQASVAVSNARSFQQVARQRSELEVLLGVSQRLAEQHSLQEVLEAIVQSVVPTIPTAEAASLWLYNPESRMLEPQAWMGHLDDEIAGLRFPVDFSLVGKVYSDAEPGLFNNARQHAAFRTVDAKRLNNVQAVFGVPILLQGQAIGALFADNFSDPVAFDSDDLRLLQALASQAATAIDSARLFEQVKAGRERLQELSLRLVEVQEDEKRHLARELHDEIGQLLTALKLTLEMARPAEVRSQELEQALELVRELLGRVRDLSLELRPSMLDDLGLLPSLLWQIDRFGSRAGLQVELTHEAVDGRRFPAQVETTAYRLIQEGLTNVARHGQVDRAHVHLEASDSLLRLMVVDEGVGFDSSELDRQISTGLAGMRERAFLLGGQFTIETSPGKGTRLEASLPLDARLERRDQPRAGKP